ncbi:Arm DNA-binding domain-containing protein [Clostridioides sp. ES-S-0054-01]|uniref:Arm DNA-binding domain-containing protein n=1 Tax=Clostridioides sp. ES-S-0054-01 TaxID=2770780 RepID=UPI0037BE3DE4
MLCICGVYRRNNWQKKQKNYGRYEKKKDAEKHLIEIKSTVNNNKLLTLVLYHSLSFILEIKLLINSFVIL